MSCRAAMLLPVLAMAVSPAAATAQNYPARPVRVVTSETGGGTDYVARVLAQELAASLGQPVIVENRGAGVYSGEIVSKATPDGHTLLVTGTSFWVGPLFRRTPYDPVRDFSPVSLLVNSPNVLVVNPALPVKSVRELIDLARARPGELNYATASTGSSSHLATELFKSMAGINVVRIPYKGTGPGIIDLIAGRVHFSFGTSSGVEQHIRSGRLRALAVTSAGQSVIFPGLPPVAATIPGYESGGGTAMLAPPRTPAAIIQRLNREVVAALARPQVSELLLKRGGEVVASSPAGLTAMIQAEIGRIDKLIKDAGLPTER